MPRASFPKRSLLHRQRQAFPSDDDAIGRQEAVQIRVIPAGIVVHQPKVPHVAVLTGQGVLRGRRTICIPNLAPGLAAQLGDEGVSATGRDTGRAQMIGEQVGLTCLHHLCQFSYRSRPRNTRDKAIDRSLCLSDGDPWGCAK